MSKLEPIEPGYFRVVRTKSEVENFSKLRNKILAPRAHNLALPNSGRSPETAKCKTIGKDNKKLS